MTQGLSILSWNIQSRDSSEGNKLLNENFVKKVNRSDIFCLQETRKVIKIPHYICFNKLRSNGRGGGVSIGFSRKLSGGIRRYNTGKREDILAVVLDKSFFKLSNDILLITCYIPPSNSSYVKKVDYDPFEELNTLLEETSEKFDIILCGDFNSRTDIKSELVLCEDIPGIDLIESSEELNINNRNNKDAATNSYTTVFMDILTQANLYITNGRTLGDSFGEQTCITYNGASTVDYFLASKSLNRHITHLKVGSLTEYSDHKSLSLSVDTNHTSCLNTPLRTLEDAPLRYKWSDESSKCFQAAQNQSGSVENALLLMELSTNTAESLSQLNDKLVNHLHCISDASLDKTKPPKNMYHNKQKWFDTECRNSKKIMNKALKKMNESKSSYSAKQFYFQTKKNYKTVIKQKKKKYHSQLNREIEDIKTHQINWSSFKKLRKTTQDQTSFDEHDIESFFNFFNNLYNETSSLDKEKRERLKSEAISLNEKQEKNDYLSMINRPISSEEIKSVIKQLNNGKSVSIDLISNEMLKNLDGRHIDLLHKLFNGCLESGTYPWTTSTITPLSKGGDLYNPDNYRAIALGSCIGKLFSKIILNRILQYREMNCPDEPNQLGFRKGAQTSDHIMTLKTTIDKYTKNNTKLFGCFVDFRKAFDSVAREALLYKIAKLGIGGNIFKTLKHMYDNTSTRIKLINKLSEAIKLKNGVEQGHPLSPELFKIFIHDLSIELNLASSSVPTLNGVNITHLFWADDLILLAMTERALQKLIDILQTFCEDWGLTVNTKKTKIMIFNKSGRLLAPNEPFLLNNTEIESVNYYCYLGIVFTPSGKLKRAQDELRKKALRAFFKLKSVVSRENLSSKALLKLFDALILPILSYGSQITFPETHIASALTKTASKQSNWQQAWLNKIAKDGFEALHLKFLKWILGVHKKASNIGCWGELARLPIGISLAKHYYNYAKRAELADSSTLLHHAYKEQSHTQLPWYKKLLELEVILSPTKSQLVKVHSNPGQVLTNMFKHMFTGIWTSALSKSPKLSFLRELKSCWEEESYIIKLPFTLRKNLTRLRISAHLLPVETGRYSRPVIPRTERFCEYCKNQGSGNIFGDEIHLLSDCVATKNSPAIFKLHLPSNGITIPDLFQQTGADLRAFANHVKFVYETYVKHLNSLRAS